MTPETFGHPALVAQATFWLSIFLDAAIKSSILLLLVAILTRALRRFTSAAVRHLFWLSSLIAVIILPILSVTLPALRLEILPPPPIASAAGRSAVQNQSVNQSPRAVIPTWHEAQVVPWLLDRRFAEEDISTDTIAPLHQRRAATIIAPTKHPLPTWPLWAAMIWLAGTIVMMGWWLLSFLTVTFLARRARPVVDRDWLMLRDSASSKLRLARRPPLLRADRARMPVTFGIFRPVILLSVDADAWEPARRRVVLLHEMAHVKRWDCLSQAIGHLAASLHWFNPLPWYANRLQRAESERACDDLVLGSGPRASDYAEHLISIARSLRCGRREHAAAIAMARPGQLEGRLRAILESDNSRRAVTRQAVVLAALLSLVLIAPLASVHLSRAAIDTTPALAPLPPIATEDAPERAIVIEVRRPLGAGKSGAPSIPMTNLFSQQILPDRSVFSVMEPGKAIAWLSTIDQPIDTNRYPILVLRYKANRPFAKFDWYHLWFDDGTGPEGGGVTPINLGEVIGDGKEHEIRKDLRALKPKGPLRFFSLCTSNADGDGAQHYELLAMRFEAAPLTPTTAPAAAQLLGDDRPIMVKVTDSSDKPIDDVTVITDPQRMNFSRMEQTGSDGLATITPLMNESGQHSLRIEKKGMTSVEVADITKAQPSGQGILSLQMLQSSSCGGRVIDESGNPVAFAVVQVLRANRLTLGAGNVPGHGSFVTNRDGRWHAEDLAIDSTVSLRVIHGDYVSDRWGGQFSGGVTVEQLHNETAVSVLKKGGTLAGTVTDADGKPVAGALVAQGIDHFFPNAPAFTHTAADGSFHFTNTEPGPITLTTTASRFGPALTVVPVSARSRAPENLVARIKLGKPSLFCIRVVDGQGKPIEKVRVISDMWRGIRSLPFDGYTDAQGRVRWPDAPPDVVNFGFVAKGFKDLRDFPLTPGGEEERVVTLNTR